MIASLRRLGDRLVHDDRGAGLMEYALLVALIAIVCFGAITYFGGESGNSVGTSCEKILAAGGDADASRC